LFAIFTIFILNFVSADVIIQEVDEASGIVIKGNLDIELREAIVEIAYGRYSGNLIATFNIYSNEQEEITTKVYLKAKGYDCYHCCTENEVIEGTFFNINSPNDHNTIDGGGLRYTSDSAEIYETGEGKFASIDFILKPGMNEIKIYQPLRTPFEYYLDSLSTFKKADYEKITIKGEGLNVKFNEHYPVEKVSDNEWVWEYSNLDVNDENLKDVLIINQAHIDPNPNPNLDNLWIYWVIGILAVLIVILAFIGISNLKK